MNAQNKTDTIVIPKFTATPIVTVMNIKQVSAKIIVWPAMMLAKMIRLMPLPIPR